MPLTPQSSMIQVFNDISALCQAITDTNTYPTTGIQPGGVPSFFGAEYLRQNTAAPQWLWVPLPEKGGPPVFGGPMAADVYGTSIGSNAAPTPLCSREAPVDIHCWGADGTSSTDPLVPYQNAETLMNILVQQCYAYASPMSVLFQGGGFEQLPEFTRAGRVYVAHLLFRFPIVQTYTRAVVTQYPFTEQISVPV